MQDTPAHAVLRPKRKPAFAEIFVFLLLGIQIALYAFMWFRLLRDPSLKTMDFVSFYAVGRLIRAGEYGHIYDLESEAVVQRQVVGGDYDDPLIFNHPPYITPLQALIADDDYVRAYEYWSVIRFLVMVLCGELIRRHLIRSGWGKLHAWLGALGGMTFFPVFIGLLGGQDTVFTLIGLLIWMFALLKKEEISAGLGLALATLSPTIAGALALPLLASRRRTGWWFIAVSLGLAIYSLLLVGVQGLGDLLDLLRLSSQGRYYGFDWPGMYNFLGLLVRAFPKLNLETARLIAWAVVFISISGMCFYWWNRREQINGRHIGIAVTLATFTSPHLNLHGLSFLLLPALGLMVILWERGWKNSALCLLPMMSGLMLISTLFGASLDHPAGYMLMLVLMAGLIWL